MGHPLTETYTDTNFSGIDNLNNYTGYTWDETLDLYFAQNRFYDVQNHRFTQEDIIKDGANWYAYCEGNPLVYVDPWGLKAGDLYINGQLISNVRYIDDIAYGNLRDITKAYGGKITRVSRYKNEYQVNIDGLKIDMTVYPGVTTKIFEANVEGGKSSWFEKRFKEDKNTIRYYQRLGDCNHVTMQVELQKFVDLVYDVNKKSPEIKYDLGTKGGIWRGDLKGLTVGTVEAVFIPGKKAKEYYDSKKQPGDFFGLSYSTGDIVENAAIELVNRLWNNHILSSEKVPKFYEFFTSYESSVQESMGFPIIVFDYRDSVVAYDESFYKTSGGNRIGVFIPYE